MGKAFAACKDNFRRWLTNPKLYVTFILIVIMQDYIMIASIRSFAREMDVGIGPWIYPFLPSSWYLCMLEALGSVFLFCDAPMINQGTPYIFVRTGRRAWLGGQILYVVLAALFYQMMFLLASVLLILPQLEFTLQWGKALGSLALTDMGMAYGAELSPVLVRQYTPIQAMLLSFSLRWMVTTLFGMLILTMNLFLPRIWGTIVGGVLALLHPTAINASGTMPFYFSPSSWTAVDYINLSGAAGIRTVSLFPTLSYIWTAGIGTIVLLIGISCWGFRKKSIYSLSIL